MKTREEDPLLKFNELILGQAIPNVTELFLPPTDYEKIKRSQNLKDLSEDYQQLLKKFEIQMTGFKYFPTNVHNETPKSGKKENYLYFMTEDNKFISMFNSKDCNFDLNYTLDEHKKSGLIKLRSNLLIDRFFFFTKPEHLNKLVIGCGHKSMVMQNCTDRHDFAITVDAYPSAYPDYVINVLKESIPQLKPGGFNLIQIEGLRLPFDLNLCHFLLSNLSKTGVVMLCEDTSYSREQIQIIHDFLKNNPNIPAIEEEHLETLLKTDFICTQLSKKVS